MDTDRSVPAAPGPEDSQRDGGAAARESRAPWRMWAQAGMAVFGVILPLLACLVELASHTWADMTYDPHPTWFHVAMILVVPAANLAALLAGQGRLQREWRVVWILNGAATGVAAYYTIWFLPTMPLAALGVLLLGLGLLPLSPLITLACALAARRRLRQLPADAGVTKRHWWTAFFAPFLVLAGLSLREPLMFHWERMAVSDDATTARSGLRWLRLLGSRDLLLRDCHQAPGWRRRQSGWLAWWGGEPISSEQARQLYFRVTGRAHDSVPPPRTFIGLRGPRESVGANWDQGLGGDAVAGVVAGLSLAQSRLDAVADADAGWGYAEWTMEFRNEDSQQREARAQVALPPGGVVARLTLWIDGEEREAAFAGRAEVRRAYQEVAVAQRRDPVLVTTCGADRVLVQCFPVPPGGGSMKVRLGVTFPLLADDPSRAMFVWPGFVERNFKLSPGLEHAVWVESVQPVSSSSRRLNPGAAKPGLNGLRGSVPDPELAEAGLRFTRSANAPAATVTDTAGGDGAAVRQFLATNALPRPTRIVAVIDAGVQMQRSLADTAGWLEQLPDGIEFAVLLAEDGVVDLTGGVQPGNAASRRTVANRLRSLVLRGGHDGSEALARAWDLADAKPGSVVAWIHGPQPLSPGWGASLGQRWERSADRQPPVLFDVSVRLGPNRLAESMEALAHWVVVPRVGTLEADLARLTSMWRGEPGYSRFVRERLTAGQPASADGTHPRHIARLWARDEVLRLLQAGQRPEAVALAGRYQLVTPVSGAVVLETREQFARHGLNPVDAATAPAVPEPGGAVWLVFLLVIAALWRLRLRRATAH